ncbi:hypothetical protein, partial [Magnetovibrio sp.]|uniref:hypothetical protein n=1 Tax=Magnetovibrio sp. TaxID=2024836 RepID=UPI002F92F7AD
TQVENHLRAMFPDLGLGAMSAVFSGAGPMDFDVFAKNERIRFNFTDIREEEGEALFKAIDELFFDIIDMPVVGVDPFAGQDFDLMIYVSDNLPFDAMFPKYKSTLKNKGISEQDYIQDLRKAETGGAIFQAKRYMRNTGEPLVVVATERDVLSAPERFTFDAQIRFALFHALTGARASHVIQPSVMNPRSVQKRRNGFAPIDRAVLRAIFNNKDWSGLAYKPKMKLLTDRVMEQLKGMSSSMFFDRHFAHDGPGSMT